MDSPRVQDWMTVDPITVEPGRSLLSARARMEREDVQRLIVVDGERRPLGILSWTDLNNAWPSPFTALEPFEVRELMARISVDEAMTRELVVVEPEATIAEAVNLMFEERVGALPVVEDGRVMGILTNSDIRQGVVRLLSARRSSSDDG